MEILLFTKFTVTKARASEKKKIRMEMSERSEIIARNPTICAHNNKHAIQKH